MVAPNIASGWRIGRFGDPGQQRPGILDERGCICDVSRRVSDWTSEALNLASLELIAAILSEFMRLMPGDVILTGTSNGVAYNKSEPDYLQSGDVLRCGSEWFGEQRTTVVR